MVYTAYNKANIKLKSVEIPIYVINDTIKFDFGLYLWKYQAHKLGKRKQKVTANQTYFVIKLILFRKKVHKKFNETENRFFVVNFINRFLHYKQIWVTKCTKKMPIIIVCCHRI